MPEEYLSPSWQTFCSVMVLAAAWGEPAGLWLSASLCHQFKKKRNHGSRGNILKFNTTHAHLHWLNLWFSTPQNSSNVPIRKQMSKNRKYLPEHICVHTHIYILKHSNYVFGQINWWDVDRIIYAALATFGRTHHGDAEPVDVRVW